MLRDMYGFCDKCVLNKGKFVGKDKVQIYIHSLLQPLFMKVNMLACPTKYNVKIANS